MGIRQDDFDSVGDPVDRRGRKLFFWSIVLGLCLGIGGYAVCSVFYTHMNTPTRVVNDLPAIDIAIRNNPMHFDPAPVEPKEDEDELLRLKGPTLSNHEVRKLWPDMKDEELLRFLNQYPLFATAEYYLSPIYQHNDKKPYVVGYVRYGHEVRATQPIEAPGCTTGKWHQIVGGAYVCSEDGFEITDNPKEPDNRYTTPKIGRVVPFLYAKAKKGSPRFQYIPTLEQEKVMAVGDKKRSDALGVVKEWLNGAYFITIDKLVEQDDRSYFRTAMGNYLRKEDVVPLERIEMRGEFLDAARKLPIAFAFGRERALYCLNETKNPQECGKAEKHARLYVETITIKDGKTYIVGPDGQALLRDEIRLAEKIERPSGIPENAKWIHINLAEQTLVAYENDRPVLATLVSSGLDTHATPTGTWQIERRYLTKTMSGPDPDHGVYEVAEVPWTMYYYGNYAIHGAYWHNMFGEKRSHGCTNIPPADARWLFRWIEPKLPRGWYAMFNQEKSWVHFTN